MNDNWEGYAACPPVRLCLASDVSWSMESLNNYLIITYINCAKINASSMPKCQKNPLPKYLKTKVRTFLSCTIKWGKLVNILVIDILKNEAVLIPNRVVHCWEPLCKENLATESVSSSKKQFRKDEHNVFVKVIQN